MGQQQTFAGLAWKDKGKVTQREQFLAEMNAAIEACRCARIRRTRNSAAASLASSYTC
jgi:hypothetical protein